MSRLALPLSERRQRVPLSEVLAKLRRRQESVSWINAETGALLEGKIREMPVNFTYRLEYAFRSTISYLIALLLMLVAMTYNSGLFLAVLLGNFVGDLIYAAPGSVSGGPHSARQHCH